VTVGEKLARARRDAGLSIAEISIRTRIRQNVIDGIEHDDYSGCGGDSGARGDIAAIASALGVDPGLLVQEYDATRRPAESEWIAAAKSSEPVIAARASEAWTPRQEPGPVAAREDTLPIMMGQPSEPVTAGEPPGPVPIGEPPHPITPGEASGPVRLALAVRYPVLWIALGGALLATAALGGILLIVGTSGHAARNVVAAGRHRSDGRGAPRPSGTRQPHGHSASSLGRTWPTSAARSRPVQLLVPASIAAFGPGGTGQGDSPQLAHQALAGKAAAPWHSAWYTTPHFGNLQPGTGLLLDMGRTVTITSARIAIGNNRGADLALRIGNAPTLASMRTVAHANGVGGIVRLKTAPMRGRYVLVWFTRLPPDQAGTFQVSVYDINLRGHP
jgi:transcriptional regulator with XRE-family HTH domain